MKHLLSVLFRKTKIKTKLYTACSKQKILFLEYKLYATLIVWILSSGL